MLKLLAPLLVALYASITAADGFRVAMLANHDESAWETTACPNATAKVFCNLAV
jgi:hypothetical protein